jgi:hypothetical protein
MGGTSRFAGNAALDLGLPAIKRPEGHQHLSRRRDWRNGAQRDTMRCNYLGSTAVAARRNPLQILSVFAAQRCLIMVFHYQFVDTCVIKKGF